MTTTSTAKANGDGSDGSIKHDEGAVTQRAVPGPALYFMSTTPAATPRAIVGVLHGYADHGARYAGVMDVWAKMGIASVAIDMRGHGRATGTRGHCSRFDEYLDDAAELARLVSDRARGAPCFLFGHSFGGLVASLSVMESPRSWRGVLLSSPYFGLALEVPKVKVLAGRVASRIAPKLALPSGLSGKDVTHDPQKAREYDEDPLVFKTATARWFTETTKAQAKAIARASSMTLPLYVLFGGADGVAKLAEGRRFYDGAGSADKTWDERANLYHEPLNEPEWPAIAAKMGDWILAHA
jgi:alpha-beta hydrolase superfamily lysophospholipase